MKKSKAFIGPIGDDIPSIFPIMAGIVLFFGTLAYANYLVQEKNDYMEIRKAALGLSYLVTQTGAMDLGWLDSVEHGACENELNAFAKSRSVKYHVILKNACNGIEFDEDPKEMFNSEKNYASCGNEIDESNEGGESIIEKAMKSNPVIMNFPIAVGCPKHDSRTKGLGLLTVVTWR